MINPVLTALAQARVRSAPMFARWCEREGAAFCPASPATVVRFVEDSAGLGVQQLWSALQHVSRLHTSLGLADPTLSEAVTALVSEIVGMRAPRSWPADRKERFKALPYDLQEFIAGHEMRRDRALRRAQNEAAAARQKLAVQQQEPTQESTVSHEDTSQQSIA